MVKLSLELILSLVGQLKDGSEAVKRFRNSIEKANPTIDYLRSWIDECTQNKGEQYNWALQDTVNLAGKQFGFEVEYGNYKSGHDGFWQSDVGKYIVVETKTTTAYQIKPSTVGGYIKKIAKQKGLSEQDIFGLFVVATGLPSQALEDTIRGGEYRNKVRVISCDSLIDLLEIMKTNNLDHKQIISLLLPFDSINIGGIVDIIKDIISVQKEEVEAEEKEEEVKEEEEPWKIDGKKWHLEHQLTTILSDALKSFTDFVGEWEEKPIPSWKQKFYVGFKHPSIQPYWATISTWRVSFLKVRVRTKKGVFKEDELKSKLGLPVYVDIKESKKYDWIKVDIRNKSEMENEAFRDFLKESLKEFKSIFYL